MTRVLTHTRTLTLFPLTSEQEVNWELLKYYFQSLFARENHFWQHKLLLESFKETIGMQILAPAGGSVSLL